MFHAPMIDMAKTPVEVKKEEVNNGLGAAVAGGPKPTVTTYPYGLCLYLEDESLKKLGLDGDMPSVGEMLHFCAVAKITSTSENEREDDAGAKSMCRRIELQIIQMGVPGADAAEMAEQATKARRSRFYPSSAPDGDDDD